MQAAPYSQLRAMLAITKASLRATLRSPSSVLFSLGFPLVFILVFGFIGGSKGVFLKIALAGKCDTANQVYQMVQQVPGITIVKKDSAQLYDDLSKGRITAIIDIQRSEATIPYSIKLITSEAVPPQDVQVLRSLLNAVNTPNVAVIEPELRSIPGRKYRTIDFILPGQLGFSLLSAGIFGVAFLFFNLRQQLVLKRFFATPISRTYIVLGEGLSRVIFQLLTAVVIVSIGHFAFNFTLVHGWVTFLEIMLLCFLALVIFMGFGFVVSGLAKTESTIPPFANMITLPQFLLSGTFFSVESFPKWLQPFCNILPLTHFNNAMRNIAFEGASLISCWQNLLVLCIWGVLVYVAAIKIFKWE
ncbi:MAG TPA: ABC transporter permease [Chitinophagaceae bacterium]|nr:ABC transporter permease [Chitinophagaceae bacterium]